MPCEVALADECDLVLDGGNVVSCWDKVILSEVIFRDNPDRDPRTLISELEGIFRQTVIIVPRTPGDFTGHADGMLRYYKNGVVLVNNYTELTSVRSKRAARHGLSILQEAGLQIVSVPYYPNENSNNTSAFGCYINFLRVGGIVFLPVFGNKVQDDTALRCFRELFPL
jgi:agmatine/peptidylarginine deiminase